MIGYHTVFWSRFVNNLKKHAVKSLICNYYAYNNLYLQQIVFIGLVPNFILNRIQYRKCELVLGAQHD